MHYRFPEHAESDRLLEQKDDTVRIGPEVVVQYRCAGCNKLAPLVEHALFTTQLFKTPYHAVCGQCYDTMNNRRFLFNDETLPMDKVTVKNATMVLKGLVASLIDVSYLVRGLTDAISAEKLLDEDGNMYPVIMYMANAPEISALPELLAESSEYLGMLKAVQDRVQDDLEQKPKGSRWTLPKFKRKKKNKRK